MKLIHDDPKVRLVTSTWQLREQYQLRESHNEEGQGLRAQDCQVP